MKKNTKEDYLQAVYHTIYYIEKHYNEELTLETLAKVSGFSKYHFHRIFFTIIEESLSTFVRRVRLSASTGKLIRGDSVTKVAQTSGYETPASFAKAFKDNFGCSPKKFSK